MRIAFIANRFARSSEACGGQASYLMRVTRLLSDAGHEVEVFITSENDSTFCDRGITVHAAKLDMEQVNWWRRLTRWRLSVSTHVFFHARSLAALFLKRHIERPFDIAQSTNLMASGLFVNSCSALPVTTRLSNHPALLRIALDNANNFDQRLRAWMEMRALKNSTSVYAPSRFLAGYYRSNDGLPVEVLQPPFSLPDVKEDDSLVGEIISRGKYLLMFGEMSRVKGIDVLATAMRKVMMENHMVRLVLVGNQIEDKRNWLGGALETLSEFKDRVEYFSAQPPSVLYPIIRNARLVCLPSRTENIGNAMLESMALKRAVIGPRGVSFDEMIVDGENGFLFEPESPDDLAFTIRKAWGLTDNILAQVGANAASVIEQLSPDIMLEKLLSHYQQTIDLFMEK